MSGSYNRVVLMGNLTRDVELRTIPGGDTQVGSFGLAINRKFKTRDGDAREEVVFVDCEAWGRTAEVLGRYVCKGRPLLVEGRLKLDQWEDKQSGQNRSKLKVVVESFQFVDSKGDDGESPSRGGGKSSGSHTPLTEDDIPF